MSIKKNCYMHTYMEIWWQAASVPAGSLLKEILWNRSMQRAPCHQQMRCNSSQPSTLSQTALLSLVWLKICCFLSWSRPHMETTQTPKSPRAVFLGKRIKHFSKTITKILCLSRQYFMSCAVSTACETLVGSLDLRISRSDVSCAWICSKVAASTFSANSLLRSSASKAIFDSKALTWVLHRKTISGRKKKAASTMLMAKII